MRASRERDCVPEESFTDSGSVEKKVLICSGVALEIVSGVKPWLVSTFK